MLWTSSNANSVVSGQYGRGEGVPTFQTALQIGGRQWPSPPIAPGYHAPTRHRARAPRLGLDLHRGIRAATARARLLKTAGFRHSSIPNGIAAIQKLGQENGFAVDATEDAGVFTEKNLARYSAVVFLNTTGDVLDPAEQDVFERYIRAGGGYVGVRSATDTEYDWPWYGRLAGAYFNGHPGNPNVRTGSYRVLDTTQGSTAALAHPSRAAAR